MRLFHDLCPRRIQTDVLHASDGRIRLRKSNKRQSYRAIMTRRFQPIVALCCEDKNLFNGSNMLIDSLSHTHRNAHVHTHPCTHACTLKLLTVFYCTAGLKSLVYVCHALCFPLYTVMLINYTLEVLLLEITCASLSVCRHSASSRVVSKPHQTHTRAHTRTHTQHALHTYVKVRTH